MSESKQEATIEDGAAGLMVNLKKIHDTVADYTMNLIMMPGLGDQNPVVMAQNADWFWGISIERNEPTKAQAILGKHCQKLIAFMLQVDEDTFNAKINPVFDEFKVTFPDLRVFAPYCNKGDLIEGVPTYTVDMEYSLPDEEPSFAMALQLVKACDFMEEELGKLIKPKVS